MTEELKQKAKEWQKENCCKDCVVYLKEECNGDVICGGARGYIAGATEATKELQEVNLKLEAKVRTLEIEQHYCMPNCSKVTDLENKLTNVSYQLEGREIELKELEKQI